MSDKNKPGQKKEKSIKLSEDARMRLMLTNNMKEMETEFDINDHIVIDLGNASTKIGFSGEDQPAGYTGADRPLQPHRVVQLRQSRRRLQQQRMVPDRVRIYGGLPSVRDGDGTASALRRVQTRFSEADDGGNAENRGAARGVKLFSASPGRGACIVTTIMQARMRKASKGMIRCFCNDLGTTN